MDKKKNQSQTSLLPDKPNNGAGKEPARVPEVIDPYAPKYLTKSGNPPWRPPKYSSPIELQEKIEEYFKSGYRKKKKIVGNQKEGYKEIEVPAVTITDLVLYLGFCDRSAFYKYEEKEGFGHAIKKARTFIEREYEQFLHENNPAGAIFALKNFGWTDRSEVSHTLTPLAADTLDKGEDAGR